MNYTVKEHNGCLKICAEQPIQIEDCCYDETKDSFVIAVKHYRGQNYFVDYIVCNREWQIVKKLTETQGVNPRFVLAPDKSVWVRMSATRTKKDGEIILPLDERERVTKEIVKSDLGTNYSFFWKGSYWGYTCDVWIDKKPDKLLQYEFDKKNLFKNRKAWKLEGLRNAVPFVQEDELYLCQQNWAERTISVSRMAEPGVAELVIDSASIGDFTWCYLVNVKRDACEFIGFRENEIHRLSIDKSGQVLEQKHIHTMEDTCFYSIMDLQVLEDDRVVVSYVCENQCGTIEIAQDSVKDVFKKKNDMLYCRGKEIAMEEKRAFHIVTDGKTCYHLATNIQAANGKSKCIYVHE